MSQFWTGKRVLVTGGRGFVGSHVVERLRALGCARVDAPSHAEFDLCEQAEVRALYRQAAPQIVLHVAGASGGIGAHQAGGGADFYTNMAMGLHMIEEGRRAGVAKFVQIGTADSYPAAGEAPFREETLWAGPPHPAHAPYAVAKRALGTMLEAYAAQYGFPAAHLLLVNVYGPGSSFDLERSQVIAAMIRKFCTAIDEGRDRVECWGTGRATRDFLFVDDVARGILLATECAGGTAPINLGSGREVAIEELAETIAGLAGYSGEIVWDASKPEGPSRRCLDTTRARELLGFVPEVSLQDGLRRTIDWWRAQACLGSGS